MARSYKRNSTDYSIVIIGIFVLYAVINKIKQWSILILYWMKTHYIDIFWILFIGLIFVISIITIARNIRQNKQSIEIKKELESQIILKQLHLRKNEEERQKRIERKSHWSMIIGMSWIEFEHYVADLFQLLGFDAKVTSPTGDGGKDIIMKKMEKYFLLNVN
ncbi:restriction endonuclease [Neobacillus drentensis]